MSFKPGRSAAASFVLVSTGDGRTLTARVAGRRRSVRFRGYRATEGARVAVFTLTRDGTRLPKPAKARVRAAKAKPVVVATL